MGAAAFALEDTLTMKPDQRTWYFAGVFDMALVDTRTADCARKVGFATFFQALSRFVTELPTDPASNVRRSFLRMPAAMVANLVILAECRK